MARFYSRRNDDVVTYSEFPERLATSAFLLGIQAAQISLCLGEHNERNP